MSLNDGGLWCPRCGAEYRIGFVQCPDCQVDLSWEKPTPAEDDEVMEQGHEVIDYDFEDWPDERLVRLELLLNGADVAHVWEGAHLLVAQSRESEVDELVDQAEHWGPTHRKRRR